MLWTGLVMPRYDADADGKLSFGEYEAMHHKTASTAMGNDGHVHDPIYEMYVMWSSVLMVVAVHNCEPVARLFGMLHPKVHVTRA